jgi:hypothetical protein
METGYYKTRRGKGEKEMTGKLLFTCLRCQLILDFTAAQKHEQETGHAVTLYQEMEGQPFAKLFVEKYWSPPGLDAEVFCSVCDKPWGLSEDNKLVKDCEHLDAKGVLRNIIVKEGSIVTEPAFEGRTTQARLRNQVMWPTPTSRDYKDTCASMRTMWWGFSHLH